MMDGREGTGYDGNNDPSLALDERLLERLLQHGPALEASYSVLGKARALDQMLRGEDTNHELTKRFAIEVPGGSASFPFAHERVTLKPKNRLTRLTELDAVVFRFGMSLDNGLMRTNNHITITYAYKNGEVANYFLSERDYQPFERVEELRIVDGELIGLNGPEAPSSFDSTEFEILLEDFEPGLQTSEAA